MFKMRKVLACLMMFALLVTGVAFAEAKTEITILTRWSGSDPMADYLDNYILEFEERHPDVKVNNISINEEASITTSLRRWSPRAIFPMSSICPVLPHW